MKKHIIRTSVASIATAVVISGHPVKAQVEDRATASSFSDEIVVTARKRNETLIEVPVVVTSVTADQLERRSLTSIDSLSRAVPQLITGESGGSAQGGSISLRGLGGNDGNPLADQSLSFNVDGVAIGKAGVRRLAYMDIAQIDVLKGPQALFFGKNSPAGIISIRTADPTRTFSGKISGGYEFEGREWKGDGYLSGPITETLGFRIAAYGSKLDGWLNNITPDSAPFGDHRSHLPKSKEFAIRGTLLFKPNEKFDARAKLSYGHLVNSGVTTITQLIYCPFGAPQLGNADECRANGRTTRGIISPNLVASDPIFENGDTRLRVNQLLASLEMNFRPTEDLTLTGVTGYYQYDSIWRDQFNSTYGVNMLVATPGFETKELSQEIRLASDFDSPINFVIGGYYQTTKGNADGHVRLGAITATFLGSYNYFQKGKAWSIFGQALWDITPTVELAAGGRYSDERKRLPKILTGTAAHPVPFIVTPTLVDRDHWTDFSPEVTLSWRPSADLTVYGAYKEGFLSGGFNGGFGGYGADLTYDQERTSGFEGGVKARIDNRLFMSLAVFHYKIKGLQVLTFPNNFQAVVENAGEATVKGAELDFTYNSPVKGLTFHGALAYNKGRYNEFLGPCWTNQSQPEGCNDGVPRMVPDPAHPGSLKPIYSAQDLSGEPIARAPEWTGNIGFDFDHPVGSGLKFGLSGNVSYSDGYITDPASNPNSDQGNYTLIDGAIRFGAEDDAWEIALIGKNLTNKFIFARSSTQVATGAGGAGDLTSKPSDIAANILRGREIFLRATLRFGN